MDPRVHLVLDDEIEEFPQVPRGLLPGRDVVEQGRSCDLEVLRC